METGRIRSAIFWDNVRKELGVNGMSWQDLAEETGFSTQCMASARYLGSTLRVVTVLRIAQILGKSPAELAGVSVPVGISPVKVSASLVNIASTVSPEIGIAMILPTLDDGDREQMSDLISKAVKMEALA